MLGQVVLDRLGAAVSPAEQLIEPEDVELLGGRGVGMARQELGGRVRSSGRSRPGGAVTLVEGVVLSIGSIMIEVPAVSSSLGDPADGPGERLAHRLGRAIPGARAISGQLSSWRTRSQMARSRPGSAAVRPRPGRPGRAPGARADQALAGRRLGRHRKRRQAPRCSDPLVHAPAWSCDTRARWRSGRGCRRRISLSAMALR